MPAQDRSKLRKSAAVATMAVSLVGAFEGLSLTAYLDPIKIPTACFGETKNIRMGMKFTRTDCDKMLLDRLIEHEDGMLACTKVPMPDTRHIALLSFTYNVGVGAYCGSTLVRKLNAGDIVGACDELSKWNKAGGIVWSGLVKRRTIEREWCMKGLT